MPQVFASFFLFGISKRSLVLLLGSDLLDSADDSMKSRPQFWTAMILKPVKLTGKLMGFVNVALFQRFRTLATLRFST